MKIEDGLFPGVPFETYSRIPRPNNSLLLRMSISPKHAREYMVNPPKETVATKFGHAVHMAILEPELFKATFVQGPNYDLRTKMGRYAWFDLEAKLKPGQLILPFKMYNECSAMCASVRAHPVASQLCEPSSKAQNELTLLWHEPTTLEGEVPVKCRVDRLTEWMGEKVAVDIKTAKSADYHQFRSSFVQYGYYRQVAMYSQGLKHLGHPKCRFINVVIEKEPPWDVVCFELDSTGYLTGLEEYRKALQLYQRCVRENKWPGRCEDSIIPLDLPPYKQLGTAGTTKEAE